MTAPALIKTADAKRLAKVAKAEGVAVIIEVDGKKVTFTPAIPETHREDDVDERPEIDFG